MARIVASRSGFWGGVSQYRMRWGLREASFKKASDRTGRNGFHDPAFEGFVGNFAGCPLTDGASTVFWVFTDDGHDLTPLFGSEGSRSSGTRDIGEMVLDVQGGQGMLGNLVPALSPVTDPVFTDTKDPGGLACSVSQSEQENDPGAGNQALLCGGTFGEFLQGMTLLCGDMDRYRFGSRHRRKVLWKRDTFIIGWHVSQLENYRNNP